MRFQVLNTRLFHEKSSIYGGPLVYVKCCVKDIYIYNTECISTNIQLLPLNVPINYNNTLTQIHKNSNTCHSKPMHVLLLLKWPFVNTGCPQRERHNWVKDQGPKAGYGRGECILKARTRR